MFAGFRVFCRSVNRSALLALPAAEKLVLQADITGITPPGSISLQSRPPQAMESHQCSGLCPL
jgi:hypothetical protein